MFPIYISLFVVLILFSAFFSSAETSLLSLDKIRLAHRVKKKNKKAMLLSRILKSPDEFFSTILIGNNIVNVAAAAMATAISIQIFPNYAVGIATGIMTFLILVFGEVLPKSIQ